MEDRTVIGQKSESFISILESYIGHIKSTAESITKQPLKNVVMGRPVNFHDNNPEANRKSQDILEKIAKSVGFKNIEFQLEPIAAAFAHEARLTKEQLALVVDLGGGTSDFTVIRLSPDKMDVRDRNEDILSTAGIKVGGTNFDKKLSMKSFMPELGLGSEFLKVKHQRSSGILTILNVQR
jgi:hypothetical chaperone protein